MSLKMSCKCYGATRSRSPVNTIDMQSANRVMLKQFRITNDGHGFNSLEAVQMVPARVSGTADSDAAPSVIGLMSA